MSLTFRITVLMRPRPWLLVLATPLLCGCSLFQSRVNDETRVLRTAPPDPVWDLDLYELPASVTFTDPPPVDEFHERGVYYSLKERVISNMIDWYLDSLRIAAIPNTEAWYANERPRLSDSLYAKYPGDYRRFEGTLHLTNDTTWHWLGDMDAFETCGRSMTLAQLLKPGHWYLFQFDKDQGRRHGVERRVCFRLDNAGAVQQWQSVRRRVRYQRVV